MASTVPPVNPSTAATGSSPSSSNPSSSGSIIAQTNPSAGSITTTAPSSSKTTPTHTATSPSAAPPTTTTTPQTKDKPSVSATPSQPVSGATPSSASARTMTTSPTHPPASPSLSDAPAQPPTKPAATTRRRRPPMLVLEKSSSKSSSPPQNPSATFSNINLTSLNRNSATKTTTISTTPQSAIFPALRTPKDIVLQDIAMQCISPGLPTFPSSVRDVIEQSNSIQKAQRKIIQQRIKNSSGNKASNSGAAAASNEDTSKSITVEISDEEEEAIANKDDSDKIDVVISSREKEPCSSTTPPPKKLATSSAALITPLSAGTDQPTAPSSSETLHQNAADNIHVTIASSNSSKPSSSTTPSPSKNGSQVNAVNSAPGNQTKLSSNKTPIPLCDTSSASSVDSAKSGINAPLSSSSSISTSKNPNIIVSGDIIIEAIPTPTQPSNPNFTRRDMSMKTSSRRAAPPRNIQVSGLSSDHPSIRSAPLNRQPLPFSPYPISQIPGYQAYVNSGANSSQTTSQSAVAAAAAAAAASHPLATPTIPHYGFYPGAHAYPSFFPSASTTGPSYVQNVDPSHYKTLAANAAGSTAAAPQSVKGYYLNVPSGATAVQSPVYPTQAAASIAAHNSARTPYWPNGLNRAPVVPRYQLATPTTKTAHQVTTPSVSTHSIATPTTYGYPPGGSNGYHPYRDARSIPVYISGRPTIPPMTASAAGWTGKTFGSFSGTNDDDDDDDDDGRDPEDAALSDNEKDDDDDDDDDLDDVEQKAIGEDDERASQANKKRRLDDVTATAAAAESLKNKKKKTAGAKPRSGSLAATGPQEFAMEAMMRAATGAGNGASSYDNATTGGLTFKDYHHFRNNVSKNHHIQGAEGLREEHLKKQRFLELCSELWDLARS